MNFAEYHGLRFESRPSGVLVMTIDRRDKLNALTKEMHRDLSRVWRDIDDDPRVRAVVVTGAGGAFCAGGDLAMEWEAVGDYANVTATMKEARDLVTTMLACDTPIVSAINGVAVGAGLAVALLADISVAGRTTRITDGHARIGVAAGDHAALVWPLLCGLAKAKYYLLTSDFLSGAEAERIGLVSRCVDDDEVVAEALRIAERLAAGPRDAIAWTKRSLNHWPRQMQPAFEASLGLEILGFFGPDVREGLSSVQEKRGPSFPSGATP